MKKFLLLFFSILSFNAIHAEITWSLSDDGTLTISGTDMPDYEDTTPWSSEFYKIKKVVINDGVTNIGNCAFSGWYANLTSVTIPNSVTSIGHCAFLMCASLTSINIPEAVTSIGNSAFNGCSSLTSITIPNSVTSIGSSAFSSCSDLQSVVVEKGNQKYDSRNECNAIIDTQSNMLIAGCKNTIIPESVTSIGSFAFSCCSGLTSITIPNSVTTIGHYAFSCCPGLTSITIPNSVTTIGDDAFQECIYRPQNNYKQ